MIRQAAEEAGAIAMGFFRRDPQVWYKEGDSPVSEADYAVDRFLKDALIGARPDYGWVSEETERPERDDTAGRFFVVDPIDGTRAYLRGEDTWCVSIAVVEAGRPVAGVLVAPALGDRFEATAGGEPTRNGAVCRVTQPGETATMSVAVPGSLRKKLGSEPAGAIRPEHPIPSLAYRLALVACGDLDATLIRSRANDWDIAAADLLIERAGGLLCDRGGNATLYRREGRRHGLLMAGSHDATRRLRRLVETIPD
ncbi:3'(2'),5'-bisphosphate nucleotidase CysQ [Jiella sp. M17.18]|uniref:3'(2'),5'-bisphosphate nucleotidase CysQ n=1 Tax=Jiella sp. M17.18 TaxID=3234247 RepID=UPI0034DE5710